MTERPPQPQVPPGTRLQEGVDYYFNEQGLMVLTEAFLKRRGYCCENGCRHCPYGFKKGRGGDGG